MDLILLLLFAGDIETVSGEGDGRPTDDTERPDGHSTDNSDNSEDNAAAAVVNETENDISHTESTTHEKKSLPKTLKKKKKTSTFMKSWLDRFHWLRYDKPKNLMFCTICEQTGKSGDKLVTGCKNFKTSTLIRHSRNGSHQLALKQQDIQSSHQSIPSLVESQWDMKQAACEAALASVYWLAKEGLPTHKYKSLIDLLEHLNCPHINELKCGDHVNYKSETTAIEMQNFIADHIS